MNTELLRFVQSRVGCRWADVQAELPQEGRHWITRVVAWREDEGRPLVRVGKTSYVRGLYVDAQGTLRVVDPKQRPAAMTRPIDLRSAAGGFIWPV